MKVIELGVQLTYYHRLDSNGQISNFLKVTGKSWIKPQSKWAVESLNWYVAYNTPTQAL